jgi:hypothetical protein
MINLHDALQRGRDTVPPPQFTTEIEHAVMRHVHRRSPGMRTQRMFRLQLAGAGVIVVLLAVVFLRSGREPAPQHAPQFTESVILLDDHICIWLEPVNVTDGKDGRP